jgi:hypothetical protein
MESMPPFLAGLVLRPVPLPVLKQTFLLVLFFRVAAASQSWASMYLPVPIWRKLEGRKAAVVIS